MRGLDTNVLVRYLINDDPRQALAAEQILEDCRRTREPVFLSVLVLCELVWVLDRSYGQSKTEIRAILEKLVEADIFRVEQEEVVRKSLAHYARGKGSFADYLIAEIGMAAGCQDTVSFDRALKGAPGFTVLT